MDISLLYKHCFRYALKWIGNEFDKTIKVDPIYDDINKISNDINQHFLNISPNNANAKKMVSHELLIKKISLCKYLLVIYCYDDLISKIVDYVKHNYPLVKILENFTNFASVFNNIKNIKYLHHKNYY